MIYTIDSDSICTISYQIWNLGQVFLNNFTISTFYLVLFFDLITGISALLMLTNKNVMVRKKLGQRGLTDLL